MTAYRRYYESWEEAAERLASERDELRARLQQQEQQQDAVRHFASGAEAATWLLSDDNEREADPGGASGASSTAAIPGPDPGACPECGEWRKAGILHECSTGSARPPGADRNIEHLGTPVGIARLKQAHSGIRDSWFEQPWVIENPTHGHPVYRQSQDEECFFCAVIAGWEHAEARVVLLEEALRDVRPFANGMDAVTAQAFKAVIDAALAGVDLPAPTRGEGSDGD